MLKPKDFHDYQRKAHIHQITHNDSMLWLDMGLGKSCITLTSIDWRMRSNQVKKTIIFGPLRVIHAVWKREAMKWEHLQHLRFNVIHGTEEKRLRQLFSDSDIYLCNYENMAWLSNVLTHYYINQEKPLPFEMIVYDEVSKVKNAQSQRVKGGKRITQEKIIEMLPTAGKFTYDELKSYGWTDIQIEKTGYANITPEQYINFTGWAKIVPHFKFRTGLTGTPASNGYYDLHGQFLAVDDGQRLGHSVTDFRTRFFSSDYMGWKYELTPLGKTSIEKNISDIVIKMDSEDYLEIPEMIPNRVMVDLPPSIMEKYREVERELFTRLDDGTEIELFSRTAVSNKCLQFCNGSPYVEPGQPGYVKLHKIKLDALESILEEAAGKPVLLAYTFKPDAERIMKRFNKKPSKTNSGFRVVNMTAEKAEDSEKVINEFNEGKIQLLIGHPQSMSYGIDGLQKVGHILVWFGLNWSLELYIQMYKRLVRQGQTKSVTMHMILCNDTMDLVVLDALRHKDDTQEGLKKAVDRYRSGALLKDGTINFLDKAICV